MELAAELAAAQDCGSGTVPAQEKAMAKARELAPEVGKADLTGLAQAALSAAVKAQALAAHLADQAQVTAGPVKAAKQAAELAQVAEELSGLASAAASAAEQAAAAAPVEE
jgi:hypothetical protein